jgi:hypothetical protein
MTGFTDDESVAPGIAPVPAPLRHQPPQAQSKYPRIRLGSANFKARTGSEPRAPRIESGSPAPTQALAPDRRNDFRQPPTRFSADANLPPPAMASSPRPRVPPPKGQMSKPASRARDPIRQQFGEAKRTVTGRDAKTERRSKRKQREDGRRLFIFAKALVKRLARAARRTRTFFWERDVQTASSPDMHHDPRYINWYAADSASAGSGVHNQDNVTVPANGNVPSLDL